MSNPDNLFGICAFCGDPIKMGEPVSLTQCKHAIHAQCTVQIARNVIRSARFDVPKCKVCATEMTDVLRNIPTEGHVAIMGELFVHSLELSYYLVDILNKLVPLCASPPDWLKVGLAHAMTVSKGITALSTVLGSEISTTDPVCPPHSVEDAHGTNTGIPVVPRSAVPGLDSVARTSRENQDRDFSYVEIKQRVAYALHRAHNEATKNLQNHPSCAVSQMLASDTEFLLSLPPMEPQADPYYVLFFKQLDGTVCSICTHPDELAGNLFARYVTEKCPSFPFSEVQMIWAGYQLERTRRLSSYGSGIPSGSTLHVVLSLRGGKPVICYHSSSDDDALAIEKTLPNGCSFSHIWPFANREQLSDEGKTARWEFNYQHCTDSMSMAAESSVPYLYYEYIAPPLFTPAHLDPSKVIAFSGTYVDLIRLLGVIASTEGLDTKNAADFITYNLALLGGKVTPEVGQYKNLALQIVRDDDCDQLCGTLRICGLERDAVKFVRFMILWKLDASAGQDYIAGNEIAPANSHDEGVLHRICSPRGDKWIAGSRRSLLEWGSMLVV